MAKITVNGEAQEVQLPLSLTELIKQNDVQQPEMVSVQLNDDFVDRTEWDALAFTFREGNKVVNIQYKTTSKQFAMENDCEIIPWNIDACIGQESIIITEGMMDALALMEIGYDNGIDI